MEATLSQRQRLVRAFRATRVACSFGFAESFLQNRYRLLAPFGRVRQSEDQVPGPKAD